MSSSSSSESDTSTLNEQDDKPVKNTKSDQSTKVKLIDLPDQDVKTVEQRDQTYQNSRLVEMTSLKSCDLKKITDKHKLIVNTLFRIDKKLNNNNWEDWKEEFQIRIRSVHLDQFVFNDWDNEVKLDKDFQSLDRATQDNIKFNIDSYLRNFLQSSKSSKEMYEKLVEHFEGSRIIRGWRLCKDLTNLLVNKPDQLDKIAFDYQCLVDKFNLLFPQVPQQFYVSLFCAIVPDQYDYLLGDILTKSDEEAITYNEIVRLTMCTFTRQREQDNAHKPKIVASIQQKPNVPSTPKNKQKGKKKNRPELICEYCKANDNRYTGHLKHYCSRFLQAVIDGKEKMPEKQNSNDNTDEKQSQEASSSKKNSKIVINALMISACNDDNIDPTKTYLDTAAANCVFNNPACASKLVKQQAIVRDWNGREEMVNGVGTFNYKTKTGIELSFDNSLYKPTASASFIAWSKFDKMRKFRLEGDDGLLKVYNKENSELILTAKLMRNGIYETDLEPVIPIVSINSIQISPKVPTEIQYRYWHKVLGHCGYDKLTKIKHLLGINENLSSKITCDTCTLSKAHRTPFPISENNADQRFELIHTDLSGIIRVYNPEGFNYFLIFVDDKSRYIFGFLIARKFQVTECYQQLTNWIHTQFGEKIKTIRSDNGTEFVNQNMYELITQNGTNHHKTAHGNPQQNARAERPMRSISELTRALLIEAKLHIKFWPYAVLFAINILNNIPHSSTGHIPHEKMFEKQPNYRDLHKFGSRIFVLDQNPKHKFSSRSKEAIFLGYPQFVKGYYVYLIEDDKIDITRDVYTSEELTHSPVQLVDDQQNRPPQ